MSHRIVGFRLRLTALLVAVLSSATGLSGQSGAKNGEWRTWGGDLGATRYAPLDQINAANFNKLEVAWRFKTENLGKTPRLQPADDAADDQRRPVLHRRRASQRGRRGRRHRRDAVDASARRRRGAREASSRRLSGRGVGYWTDGKGDERIFYVSIGYQLVGLDAKTGDPLDGVRHQRRRRPEAGQRSAARSDRRATSAWNGAPVVAQERRHRRRRASRRLRAAQQDEREGLHPRLRRPHRQAALDLPHDSAARRIRQRHLAEGLVVVHRTHRRVDAADRRRGARHRLPAGRDPDRRLLRRASARQQSLRREPRRGRSRRPASASGTSSSCITPIWDYDIPCAPILADITVDGRRDQGGRAADQAGLRLRVRSRDRPAGVADRGAAGRDRARCRPSGTRRRSRFRPSRRRSSARASSKTT